MSARRRLDAELVRRGLVPSLEQAQAAIAAGLVLVSGAVASKAAHQIRADEPVVISGPPPRFVSRGGAKLDAALDAFSLDLTGRQVLDAGSSTGGFTDCCLQRGAAHVHAIDVGTNQMHERLRTDPRVTVREQTNIRAVTPDIVGVHADLLVADLSFISLRTVAAPLVALVRNGGDLVLLVKPHFEAARAEASRAKGVIREPAIWRRVLAEVRSAVEGSGAAMMGLMVSPLLGAEGNVEFLAWFRRAPSHADALITPGDDLIDVVVASVAAARAED
ncbi:MAG TPA: TlyA family RNA methyltransferase [Acidimicrobiales bacterium]|nr:TlyA family RNA methyltransferase [Acidimicrobiales bacterium]